MIAESIPPASHSNSSAPLVPVQSEPPTRSLAKIEDEVEILDRETQEDGYQRLRDQSEKLVAQGRLQEALECLERAADLADEIGDAELGAMARCNVAFVGIAMGRMEDFIGDLRLILMRNFSAETSFAAAYNLSCAYENVKEFKKSLFYGRIARERARAAEDEELLAKSLNQMGNGLLGDSRFQQAVSHFNEALALMLRTHEEVSLVSRANRAYCMIVLGQTHEGMADLFSVLRRLRRRKAVPVYQAGVHTFLCCGYLDLNRPRRAWLHAMSAKELAEATGDQSTLKHALFMLGEVERFAGDTAASREWFGEMQRRFYPDNPEIPELLSVVGMTQVVNLRA